MSRSERVDLAFKILDPLGEGNIKRHRRFRFVVPDAGIMNACTLALHTLWTFATTSHAFSPTQRVPS